jgi:hypothetical protein
MFSYKRPSSEKEQWENEIMNFEQEIIELHRKWKILPSLNQAEASLERYQSKRDS